MSDVGTETRLADVVRDRIYEGGYVRPLRVSNTREDHDHWTRTVIRPKSGYWTETALSALSHIICGAFPCARILNWSETAVSFKWVPQ